MSAEPLFVALSRFEGFRASRRRRYEPRCRCVLAAGNLDALRTVEERGAALLLARFEPGSLEIFIS